MWDTFAEAVGQHHAALIPAQIVRINRADDQVGLFQEAARSLLHAQVSRRLRRIDTQSSNIQSLVRSFFRS